MKIIRLYVNIYWALYKVFVHISFRSSHSCDTQQVYVTTLHLICFFFYALLGGVESRHSRAWFCIQKTGPNTMRRRDGSLPYTRVLDLPLQGGEALQVWLCEIGA